MTNDRPQSTQARAGGAPPFLALLLVAGMLIVAPAPAEAQDSLIVRRDGATMREGPGSYYPVIADLILGLPVLLIAETTGWNQVQADTLIGYVAQKAFEERPERQDPFRHPRDRPRIRVYRHGISAGVKGLASRIGNQLGAREATVDALLDYRIDARLILSMPPG